MFDDSTAVGTGHEALAAMHEREYDCVVLDLRTNGGGSLPESIKLTGLFIDRGAVAWPNNIDLAPDAMYNAIKANREWVLR